MTMINKYHDEQYLWLLKDALDNGTFKTDRTGTGTYSVMSRQMRFDLSDGSIPLLTTKKMFTRGILKEIEWYWKGLTNIKFLLDNNVHIWDDWAAENGDLGPVYGAMWRAWPDTQVVPASAVGDYIDRGYEAHAVGEEALGEAVFVVQKKIDQLAEAIDLLKNSPDSRRIIVNSWNPALLPVDMKNPEANPAKGLQALPPCHCMFQFYVADGKLSCDLRQRSADIGLGVPFNIVQYSIMLHVIAKMVGLKPGEFVWNGVDCHVYANHVEKLREQLDRQPFASPYIEVSDEVIGIKPENFTSEMVKIVGYDQFHPKIDLEVAV